MTFPPSKSKYSESALHKAVADYLWGVLPAGTWFSTFPSGGGGVVRGAQLKRMGLKAGVPDILIIHEGRAHWIELKAQKGRLSDDQKACIQDLVQAGCAVEVCRSLTEVSAALSHWNISTRGRVAA